MADVGLPQRAKPGLLHEICRLARQSGGVSKSEVYESIDENRKTLRKTLQYGVKLGFLNEDGDRYELTPRGSGISYSSSFEGEEPIIEAFREAIEEYPPYRHAIAGAYKGDHITTVKDQRVVERDSFKTLLERSIDDEVADREANVLVKTAEAAGLGEWKAGRRSYQTRLIVDDEFEEFASRLAEEYPLPRSEEEKDEPSETSGEPGEEVVENEETVTLENLETTTAEAEGQEEGTVKVPLTVEVDAKELAKAIRKVQEEEL